MNCPKMLWVALLALAGCASPIVGGECLQGYNACDGQCVELATDPNNCGRCGRACSSDEMCVFGSCVGTEDAGPDAQVDGGVDAEVDAGIDAGPDAAMPDAGDGGVDASLPDAEVPDGDVPDGGDSGVDAGPVCACDVGELCCDNVCVRPDRDPAHCGGCGMACSAGELCADGTCAPICTAPLTLCAGLCVDLQDDPDHCGMCNEACPSGLCIDGACGDGVPGHVVLVGHDYSTSRVGMRRVAGNAVFIARGGDVDVLVYEGDASAAVIAGVDAAIDQVATELGRTWSRSPSAGPEHVPFELGDTDVFVVYPQIGGTDVGLRQLGADWVTALGTFLRGGGVVVVFDGGGSHEGTWQILGEAGLINVVGRTPVNLDSLSVVTPADIVAGGVPLAYRAEVNTVRFDSPDTTVVVAHPDGPVVIHRTLLPE